jgi:hypothetical protein
MTNKKLFENSTEQRTSENQLWMGKSLNKYGVRTWDLFNWLRTRAVVNSYQHGTELTGFKNGGKLSQITRQEWHFCA